MAATGSGKRGTTSTSTKETSASGRKKSGAGSRSDAGASRKARRQTKQEAEAQKHLIRSEAGILVTAFLGLVFFLSNFGLFGTIGGYLSFVEKGLFGLVAYAFPILVLLAVVLYAKNRGQILAPFQFACALLMIPILSAIAELLFGSDELLSISAYFEAGAKGALSGGACGGVLAGVLRSLTGRVGAYLILILLFLLCMVVITERSFVSAARSGAEKTVQAARAGAEFTVQAAKSGSVRYAEMREEARQKRLAEREARRAEFEGMERKERAERTEQFAKEARIYAGYGRDIIGGEQPGMDTDPYEPSLNASEKGAAGKNGSGQNVRGMQPSGLDETMILPRPDDFVGKIVVPDPDVYDSDSVPFEEDRKEAAAGGNSRDELPTVYANKLGQPESSAYEPSGHEPSTHESFAHESFAHESSAYEPSAYESSGYESSAYESSAYKPSGSLTSVSKTHETNPAASDQMPAGLSERHEEHDSCSVEGCDPNPSLRDFAWQSGGTGANAGTDSGMNQTGAGSGAVLSPNETNALVPEGWNVGFAPVADEEEAAADRDETASETVHHALMQDAFGRELEAPSSYEAGRILQEKAVTAQSAETRTLSTGAFADPFANPFANPSAGVSGDAFANPAAGGSANVSSGAFAVRQPKAVQQPKAIQQPKAVPSQAERARVEQTMNAVKKEPPRPYVFPPYHLLKKGPKSQQVDQAELRETAVKLQQVLRTFGVGVTVTNVTRGPSVTRYEMAPEVGVKVSRITALQDDIKLALAASDIRIEAPIPGKSAVGIEVPNRTTSMVYFRDLIETEAFRTAKSKLSFGIGRDIQGQAVIGNIAKMPHLLIAGATGSGKSVGINTLIMSLLYKAKPEEVRMIMIDPKVVELSVYNGIPHLLIPVVTDPKKAVSALGWAVAEMNDRYKKFAETGTRNLAGYNEKMEQIAAKLPQQSQGMEAPQKLPQIVIVIDELAELMMTASKDVEADIVRLAQLARAAGMHLIIATQRPSVDVITGLIKANIPSRIAFKTSSNVDSRTILDMAGAERLLGNGDMLYFPQGAKKPMRVQGAFVSDEEVEAVAGFLAKNSGGAYEMHIDDAIQKQMESPAGAFGASDGGGDGGRDEYFAEAGRMITEKKKASIGMLQRMYKIGFNRAARIMDQLSEAGVVGEEEGTKPRKVLMTPGQFEAFLHAPEQ